MTCQPTQGITSPALPEEQLAPWFCWAEDRWWLLIGTRRLAYVMPRTMAELRMAVSAVELIPA